MSEDIRDFVGLSGVSKMLATIKQVQKSFPDRVVGAMRMEGEIETTEAKKRTPVYTGPTGPGKPIPGVLRNSVHLDGPHREGRKIWMRIMAGGEAGAYAIPQHENLEYFHEVGQAKYIESVVMESRPFMAARIAARLKAWQ